MTLLQASPVSVSKVSKTILETTHVVVAIELQSSYELSICTHSIGGDVF